jgi:hypothetical protein
MKHLSLHELIMNWMKHNMHRVHFSQIRMSLSFYIFIDELFLAYILKLLNIRFVNIYIYIQFTGKV